MFTQRKCACLDLWSGNNSLLVSFINKETERLASTGKRSTRVAETQLDYSFLVPAVWVGRVFFVPLGSPNWTRPACAFCSHKGDDWSVNDSLPVSLFHKGEIHRLASTKHTALSMAALSFSLFLGTTNLVFVVHQLEAWELPRNTAHG